MHMFLFIWIIKVLGVSPQLALLILHLFLLLLLLLKSIKTMHLGSKKARLLPFAPFWPHQKKRALKRTV